MFIYKRDQKYKCIDFFQVLAKQTYVAYNAFSVIFSCYCNSGVSKLASYTAEICYNSPIYHFSHTYYNFFIVNLNEKCTITQDIHCSVHIAYLVFPQFPLDGLSVTWMTSV